MLNKKKISGNTCVKKKDCNKSLESQEGVLRNLTEQFGQSCRQKEFRKCVDELPTLVCSLSSVDSAIAFSSGLLLDCPKICPLYWKAQAMNKPKSPTITQL